MKRSLLSTASAVVLSAMIMAGAPAIAYAAATTLNVSSVDELKQSAVYIAASDAEKANLVKFVTGAVNKDPNVGNSLTSGAYQINVVPAQQAAASQSPSTSSYADNIAAQAASMAAQQAASDAGKVKINSILKDLTTQAHAKNLNQAQYNQLMTLAAQEIIDPDRTYDKNGNPVPLPPITDAATSTPKALALLNSLKKQTGDNGFTTEYATYDSLNYIGRAVGAAADPDPYRANKIKDANTLIPDAGKINTVVGGRGITIDSDGIVREADGSIIGKISKNGDVYDKDLKLMNDRENFFLSNLLNFRWTYYNGQPQTETAPASNNPPTAQAAPVTTISLPAAGETKNLANGYTADSNGNIRDAGGKIVGRLLDDGKFVNPDATPADDTLTRQLVSLFDTGSTPKAAGNSTPATSTASDVKDTDTAAANTGDRPGFFGRNANENLDDQLRTTVVDVKTAIKKDVTNAEINDYIRANLNSPDKIATAMRDYGVDLNRIQEATGYTREQMADYIAKSGNAQLKDDMGKWQIAKGTSTGVGADYPVKDVEVNDWIRANLNDPARIADAMVKHGVDFERIQQATNYTNNDIKQYISSSGNPDLQQMLANWHPAEFATEPDPNNVRGNSQTDVRLDDSHGKKDAK